MIESLAWAVFFLSVGIFCITFFAQEINGVQGFGEILACILFLVFGAFCTLMAITIVIHSQLEKFVCV